MRSGNDYLDDVHISENQGRCAKCNSESIHYDTYEFDGVMLWFPYTCDDCGHIGDEVYDLEYSHTN